MALSIEAVAFLALLVLTLIRLPSAIRQPSSRPTWIATITGLAAVFMVGVVVPLPIVDGAAGAGVVATPVRSIFQTNAAALKLVLPVDWTAADGAVQTLTAVAWG